MTICSYKVTSICGLSVFHNNFFPVLSTISPIHYFKVPQTTNLKWANSKVRALGVWFCINYEESKQLNYEEKVHKVGEILNDWENKRLTLIGKIAVIKALAASQLV